MDTGWGVYIKGKFAYQVFSTRQGAELCACAWHCPHMSGACRKELDATFKSKSVRVVPVSIIPSAPTFWPETSKP